MSERFKWKCGHVWIHTWTKRNIEMLNEGYPYIESYGCPFCNCYEVLEIKEIID